MEQSRTEGVCMLREGGGGGSRTKKRSSPQWSGRALANGWKSIRNAMCQGKHAVSHRGAEINVFSSVGHCAFIGVTVTFPLTPHFCCLSHLLRSDPH